MKFTLKDFQDEAVIDVLSRLNRARRRWHEDSDRHAFSLTAATGSGKTVMAAAVFEALFYGDDRYEFEGDGGAVVIWFSDDPSLNEQTRFRLIESSDRLQHTDLVVVENTFNRPKFDAGKIYFLNTQKLGKKSLLVRGFEGDDVDGTTQEMRPDLRSHTIWDTIRNTVEDPILTLYLVLDEAHRGMGSDNREKSTIVKRLINGDRGVPGIPVVWGISATVERFNKAMEGAQGRSTLPPVTVDAARVQESGLLKDTIVLDIPDEVGDFDTVLVRRAVDKLRESTEEWAAYTAQQDSGRSVLPLLVLQVPNTPNPNDIGRTLDTIFQQWPDVSETSVAHVFGEHTTLTFGKYSVPYIQPQRVQDETWVRVLIAKDAISTGWDCPRAEVMVSFRPAKDQTYIAQLLGRMVRTPLARRIPGSEKLNSVDCLLPKFDKSTVENVVTALRDSSGGDTPPTDRILINPKEMKPNQDVPEAVWKKFVSLPSQTRPQRGAKPAIRLTSLAHELASDGLLPGAGDKAHSAMHKMLDDFTAERAKVFAEKCASVMTVEGRTIVVDAKSGEMKDGQFQADADDVVVSDAFRRTARIISPDIARTYTIVRAHRRPEAADDLDDALIEARQEVAALHLLENLQIAFDAEAKRLSDSWFAEYHDNIKELPHDRQDAYRQVIALSTEPQDIDLAQPVSRFEPTKVREANGSETSIPTYKQHLLCDEQGLYPAALRKGEHEVLTAEMGRDGFKFWYRNPDRPTQDSLGIAYEDGDDTRIVRPDFIFFVEQDGKVMVDLIDPHGFHLADALPKLEGLARYAETNATTFRRIEAVAAVGDKLRKLDLALSRVRQAIMKATSAEALYQSATASDYT
jgi:hypothetical protein